MRQQATPLIKSGKGVFQRQQGHKDFKKRIKESTVKNN